MTAVFELVFSDFTAERVAVNAENSCGAALIAVGMFHGAFDEAPFKFGERFVEQNATIHHLSDERFQLIFHDSVLRVVLGAALRGQFRAPKN